MGRLSCYITESVAESEIGKTALTAYFYPEYGFVRLHYTNIDGSRLRMQLLENSRGKVEVGYAQGIDWYK